MAALDAVSVIGWPDAEPVELGGGSWSRILVDASIVPTSGTTFGFSVFAPGTATSHMSHVAEELAYVVAGSGHLQLDDGVVEVAADQACHIPAGVWHAVVNDHESESLLMVFAFASPTYPSTERRPFERETV